MPESILRTSKYTFSGIITYKARFQRDNISPPHPLLGKGSYTTPQGFQSINSPVSDSETEYFLETHIVPLQKPENVPSNIHERSDRFFFWGSLKGEIPSSKLGRIRSELLLPCNLYSGESKLQPQSRPRENERNGGQLSENQGGSCCEEQRRTKPLSPAAPVGRMVCYGWR